MPITNSDKPNPDQEKNIIILAGPNGAGKTTFARSFLPNEARCTHFINADLIAAGLSPFAPELAAVKAGRLMLNEVHQPVAKGQSFALEKPCPVLAILGTSKTGKNRATK